MDKKDIITEFPVTIYGDLKKYNDVISKGRCRIFYKYGNRNGTYITDEFADKLLSTIAYAPVKGIYSDSSEDFTDHGAQRDLGRIYGVVPETYNLTWEDHEDEDGVTRTYACVDVLLFTALYSEAEQILQGKGQSMELFPDSIVGDWKVIEGKRYYVFENACFLGLQALGDDTEPCFEGAAFYSLYESLKNLVEKLELNYNNFHKNGQGGNNMPVMNFKLSDNAKANAIWNLLNPNFTEEGQWTIDCAICDIYDDYALVYNYEVKQYERAYYTKNDETDTVEITSREVCYILDVTETEKKALEVLHSINGSTYEKVDEKFNEIETLTTQNSEYSTKIAESETEINTLTAERDEISSQLAAANATIEQVTADYTAATQTIEALTAERDELASFKHNLEVEQKKGLIDSYTSVPEEVRQNYIDNIDSYSLHDLDVNLTYDLKNAHPEMFNTNTHNPETLIPKDNTQLSGLEKILSKYENK